MAQQAGIIPIKGTIGNITFYKSADGYLVREKGGVDGNRIKSDPAFQRTRENGAEFGRAGKAAKLLRTALRALLQNTSDNKMVSRLTRQMVKVLQADATNPRGLRNVIDGETQLLQDFEFNANGKLGATMFAPFTAVINRVTGELTVELAPFIPVNMINAPAGATHFRIISAGVDIDFELQQYVVGTEATAELPWDNTATDAIELVNEVTPNSTHPLFMALGIEFYQEINGIRYPLKNGGFNALSLVKVEGPVTVI